jgi:hypothetical protein
MSVTTPGVVSIPTAVAAAPRGWIESPRFDLVCFTLSPLVGLMIAFATIAHPAGIYVGIAASFLLGVPHYLSTFTFYLGDENRARYFAQPLAFLAAPALIFAIVLGLRVVNLDTPVILAMFVWNIWHVALQSAGILAIYRRLHGGPDGEKNVAKVALFSTGGTMALWQPTTFPPLREAIDAIYAGAYRALTFVLLAIAIVSLTILFTRIARRSRHMSFAETSFLVSSILLFHPYLWMRDGNQATLAMLAGHFIQYLAIVWLLNARKYGASRGSAVERTLGTISRKPLFVYVLIAGTGVMVWLMSRAAAAAGVPMAFVVGLNSLALIHFYLDGRIWAFRDPFVRKTIGAVLVPEERRVA